MGVVKYIFPSEIKPTAVQPNMWGVPLKFQQGAFDAFQLLKTTQYTADGKCEWKVRIVQLTIATPTHSIKIKYVSELVTALNALLGSLAEKGIITHIDLVIVLPQNRLGAFKYAPIVLPTDTAEAVIMQPVCCCAPWNTQWSNDLGGPGVFGTDPPLLRKVGILAAVPVV
jgi:hypothetical protein